MSNRKKHVWNYTSHSVCPYCNHFYLQYSLL